MNKFVFLKINLTTKNNKFMIGSMEEQYDVSHFNNNIELKLNLSYPS